VVELSLAMLTLLASLHSAKDCPSLFGDEVTHAQNRRAREAKLRFIDDSSTPVLIVHSTEWSEPEPIILAGVSLLDTENDHAIVELESANCAKRTLRARARSRDRSFCEHHRHPRLTSALVCP
jgi:hypothetical protein